MRQIHTLIYMLAVLLIIPSCAGMMSVSAQSDRSFIRQGNKAMRDNSQDSPAKAELAYRKALKENPANTHAMYNLGCALMAQMKDSMALETFKKSAQSETSKQRRAMSFHNMGVLLQRNQMYAEAIEAYKQALRLIPSDNETRYNLVLCQRQLKNNPDNNKNNNKDKNKDKNKDQNKDKDKDKDKNKEQDKDEKQDQNKDDKKDQNKDQQDQQNKQMSKENAEQLLKAAEQQEKNTQRRMQQNKAQHSPQRNPLQKNW